MKKKDNNMSDDFFPKKLMSKLPENYQETTDSKTNDELLKEILKSSHCQADVEKDRDSDAKLESIKEDYKALAGGYRDMLATENAKIKYCLFLLKSRGG